MPPTNSSGASAFICSCECAFAGDRTPLVGGTVYLGAVQWSRFQRNLVHSLPYLHCKRLHHFAEAAKMM
jgi:hypothetical protein